MRLTKQCPCFYENLSVIIVIAKAPGVGLLLLPRKGDIDRRQLNPLVKVAIQQAELDPNHSSSAKSTLLIKKSLFIMF